MRCRRASSLLSSWCRLPRARVVGNGGHALVRTYVRRPAHFRPDASLGGAKRGGACTAREGDRRSRESGAGGRHAGNGHTAHGQCSWQVYDVDGRRRVRLHWTGDAERLDAGRSKRQLRRSTGTARQARPRPATHQAEKESGCARNGEADVVIRGEVGCSA